MKYIIPRVMDSTEVYEVYENTRAEEGVCNTVIAELKQLEEEVNHLHPRHSEGHFESTSEGCVLGRGDSAWLGGDEETDEVWDVATDSGEDGVGGGSVGR